MAQTAPTNIRNRVILWTATRCCSSVFERSIRELQGVKCLFEPHQAPFYYGLGKLEQKIDPKKGTYEFAEQSLLANYEGYDYLFAKDMAGYIPNELFSKFTEGEFADFKHTFLIRDPQKSVPSHWKACTRSGFNFSTDELTGIRGYSKLYELLEFIRSTGRDVIVIDGADLLKSPEYIMKLYCHRTGLPYDRKMLTWSPGEVKDWTANKFYKDWHWNAMYSSGFGTLGAPRQNTPQSSEEIPDIVDEKIEECIPCYEAMKKYCVKLPL